MTKYVFISVIEHRKHFSPLKTNANCAQLQGGKPKINFDGSSQKGSVIQCVLPPSIPSRPPMAAERVGLIFIIILVPNYIFSPPEIPAKCAQQRGRSSSIKSDDVYMYLCIPALPEFPPACPAPLPAPTASKAPYPAPKNLTNPARHPGSQISICLNFGWWAVAQMDKSSFWAIPGT
jgi:hypothetical protein